MYTEKCIAIVRDSFGENVNAIYYGGDQPRLVLYSDDGDNVFSIDKEQLAIIIVNLLTIIGEKEVTNSGACSPAEQR